ncbi:MAG: segregation/condensation protein A [Halobacteriaceae archaeon]
MTSAPDVLPEGDIETAEDEVEPVELLVQLAEDGEIDPWDIDVVEVTDAFLARLDETDLRTSGRALFYASVLLRMKSEAIVEGDEDGDEEAAPDDTPEPWMVPEEGPPGAEETRGDPVAALEAEMDRRLERKSARGTPETLDELVRELREAERGSWWKSSRSYDTSESTGGFQRGMQTVDYHRDDADRGATEPTEEDVTGTAHGEDIELLMADVSAALEPARDGGREEVLFAEIDDAAGSRVETYLALLFLDDQGGIALEQDALFGDLWIRLETA